MDSDGANPDAEDIDVDEEYRYSDAEEGPEAAALDESSAGALPSGAPSALGLASSSSAAAGASAAFGGSGSGGALAALSPSHLRSSLREGSGAAAGHHPRASLASSGGTEYRRLAPEEIEGARAAVIAEVCTVLDTAEEAAALLLAHYR